MVNTNGLYQNSSTKEQPKPEKKSPCSKCEYKDELDSSSCYDCQSSNYSGFTRIEKLSKSKKVRGSRLKPDSPNIVWNDDPINEKQLKSLRDALKNPNNMILTTPISNEIDADKFMIWLQTLSITDYPMHYGILKRLLVHGRKSFIADMVYFINVYLKRGNI